MHTQSVKLHPPPSSRSYIVCSSQSCQHAKQSPIGTRLDLVACALCRRKLVTSGCRPSVECEPACVMGHEIAACRFWSNNHIASKFSLTINPDTKHKLCYNCECQQCRLSVCYDIGKNGAGQPLTDEQRQAYTNNHAAVHRHYKQLQLQYNVLRTGMVRNLSF